MLGIRRYQNIAIDLWQGKHPDFASDTLVITQFKPKTDPEFIKAEGGSNNNAAPDTFTLSYSSWGELNELWSIYLKSSPVHSRHLAIAFTCLDISAYSKEQVKDFFLELKKYLDTATPELKRVSLVFESLAVHDIFQDELFALFPYQE